MTGLIGPRERHEWRETPYKPWTCKRCGCYTANLRHIEHGFCRHEWCQRLGMTCRRRCRVVLNNRNGESPCIGTVKLALRRAPTEHGGVVYTDDAPLREDDEPAPYDWQGQEEL